MKIKVQQILSFATSFVLLLSYSQLYAQSAGQGLCSMPRGMSYNFYVDYSKKQIGMFGNDIERLPPVVIENCKQAAGKYLGFGLALRKPTLNSDVFNISFDGKLNQDICKIENAPKELTSSTEKEKSFQEQFKLLRSCTSFELTHLENKNIEFEPNQRLCKMQKLSNGKIQAQGDFCFFRLDPGTRVAISVVVNPQCANQEFLNKNNLQISDIEALLQAFVVDNPDGEYVNDQIGTAKYRFAFTPSDKIMPVNKDVDPSGVQFPTVYSPDIYMGSIKIQDNTRADIESTVFDLSLFIDNNSLRKCANGICAGPGDYQVPVATEVSLYEIRNGKKVSIDSWVMGNILDPFVKSNWQGVYRLGRRILDGVKIEPGRDYQLDLTFYNPYDDFVMLTQRFQELLLDYTLFSGTPGKDVYKPMSELGSLKNIPQIGTLAGITSQEDLSKTYEQVRQFFQKFGNDSQFPPFYVTLCDLKEKNCLNSRKAKFYLKLQNKFHVGENKKDDDSFPIENFETTRFSSLTKDTPETSNSMTEVVCQ